MREEAQRKLDEAEVCRAQADSAAIRWEENIREIILKEIFLINKMFMMNINIIQRDHKQESGPASR